MAINCCVVPFALIGSVGVTAIDTSVAAVTVKFVVPLIVPDVAVMVTEPVSAAVAIPLVPDALLIVATALFVDDHVTAEVISWVVLSVYIPVAVNCCVVPFALTGLVGVMLIDDSVAGVTVKPVVPLIDPRVAVIVTEPVLTAVPRPLDPAALLIVAIDVPEENHVTDVVIS